MDPEQGIKQWLQYAKGADHAGVTGQRAFRSDLELVNAMEEEAKSLFLFARDIGLDFSETLPLRVDRATPFKEGNEHRVFMATVGNIARVVKVTHPGKYGRNEHTPYLYLERWALLNRLVPAISARFEDCVKTASGEISIITSMAFFKGEHPEPQETDMFIREELEFEILRDRSTTLDYVSRDGKLIIRDCHPRNWIRTNSTLIPIDIIPELV